VDLSFKSLRKRELYFKDANPDRKESFRARDQEICSNIDCYGQPDENHIINFLTENKSSSILTNSIM